MLRAQGARGPAGWIAQPVVQLSTVPTLFEHGMRPRHVDLRPFAVNDGHKVWVLPGGLTRVALPEGELIVNSSPRRRLQGHLGAGRRPRPRSRRRRPRAAARGARAARWTPARRSTTPVAAAGRAAAADAAAAEDAVLSRIAESLFWIGRYVERAEDTARILDVQTQMMVEDPTVDDRLGLPRRCSSVMGTEVPEGRLTLESALLPAGLRHRRGHVDHVGHRAVPGRAPAGPARRCRPTCGRSSTRPTGTCPSGRFRAMRTQRRVPAGCASGPRSSTASPTRR